MLQSMGLQGVRHDLATEQQQEYHRSKMAHHNCPELGQNNWPLITAPLSVSEHRQTIQEKGDTWGLTSDCTPGTETITLIAKDGCSHLHSWGSLVWLCAHVERADISWSLPMSLRIKKSAMYTWMARFYWSIAKYMIYCGLPGMWDVLSAPSCLTFPYVNHYDTWQQQICMYFIRFPSLANSVLIRWKHLISLACKIYIFWFLKS